MANGVNSADGIRENNIMFKLEFKTDNSAFSDGNMEYEIKRILVAIGNRVDCGNTSGSIRDINGNTIGTYELEEEN